MRGSACLWQSVSIFYRCLFAFALCGSQWASLGLNGFGIRCTRAQPPTGSWQVVLQNAGVVATSMALTHYNTVIFTDQTHLGPSNISLANGACRQVPNSPPDCSAHSVEYTIADSSVRPLDILTDTGGSSGAFTMNGTLVQTGGQMDGALKVRLFVPCSDKTCDWNESAANVSQLQVPRSFASALVLPDDRLIVVGGIGQLSYEFVPRTQPLELYSLLFLYQNFTNNLVESNLYPFLHLNPDGNLFVFANQDSILLNYINDTIIRSFPRMPGYESRNYPASGSSVMLPLSYTDGFQAVDIMVCGGARQGATEAAKRGIFLPASQNCGRLRITDPDPFWVMEAMPTPRVMNDMVVLPSGDVLLINGCEQGTASWGLGRVPSLAPFLYHPNRVLYQRFETLAPSPIPRLYQSSAALQPDGRVLIGGSNPNGIYAFSQVQYPTELRIEAFSPPYLSPEFVYSKPNITFISTNQVSYGSTVRVAFVTIVPLGSFTDVKVVLYSPPFTTYSFSTNQRLLILQANLQIGGDLGYQVDVVLPPSVTIAPPGFYMMFVLYQGIPSQAIWVQLSPAQAAQSGLGPF